MILVDHGFFRLAYLNLHRVTPDFWRSAQPAPHHIRRLAKDGLKTIVNLRGATRYGSWALECEEAARCGIAVEEFLVLSRGPPDKEGLLAARAFFARLEKPVLVHCKSGADRAGFMSTLHLLLHEGRSVDEALSQLSPRYGHFRFSSTGILDRFFELYRDEGEAKGLDFETWVRDRYDPDALLRGVRTGFWSKLFVDGLLRRE